MIKTKLSQFQRNLGCFLGLNEGLNRHNEAVSIKNSTDFINFIQSDTLFPIKSSVKPEFAEFNQGLSTAHSKLYKSFNKVLIPEKLSEIFYDFKVEIGNYGFYFLQEFLRLSRLPIELGNNFESIQELRKQKPYFMGLVTSFFIFSNEVSFLQELDLTDILQKFRIMRFRKGFYPIFYIGFIEMLLKLHAYNFYYADDLKDYEERIIKIEQKLIQKARNYRITNKIFSLNEIFSNID
ncbi:hypothetical protein DSAG12_02609 [Promethearchaeum syntrophicum]|uniref:Uncharacterized protein n=1 Tax=Promethearchaeum syntrophicum TaxID=2594042 RepID=A0A5B9DBX4_9ARCH|nr:hypothetical protein [Candidatus Prometheoarchaeum syntrophicum]QEE16779.1 hypothetical protein DSAG12_02609 [Candidatus Prometheoarchaeum syntrophicum]